MKLLKYLFLLIPVLSFSQNVRISDMPAASDLVGAYIPIIQGGLNKKAASSLFTVGSGFTLTTTGNSGAATFLGAVLNVPNYTLAGLGGTSLNSFSALAPLVYNNSTGQFSLTNGVFTSNVTFVLPGSQSFGKYTNGMTAAWAGLTPVQAMLDAAIAYINPVFNSFSNGQSSPVEVGTTLSGSKTFIWSITVNSGTVPTIDIYDNTAATTLLAGTPNSGSQAATITTIQLNSTGATQSWKGIGNNTSPTGTFNSSNYVVTAYFYRFYGPTSSSPTTSSAVRGLPSNSFHTGATTFTLNTGTTNTIFVVALPPGVTISSVIDLDALNANITSQYVLTGTVNVLDAGSTNRTYNIYQMTLGSPYSSSHRHSITTNN
jgi:hypothetical protein